MAKSPNWTYEQTLIAFRIYLNTEYGKLNQSNVELAQIAERIGRSPSALIMKCCNFASLDPFHAERGVKGLPNKSKLENQIWHEFEQNSDAITLQMEAVWDRLTDAETDETEEIRKSEPSPILGPSEVERAVKTRRLQRSFRSAVLVGYKHRCALTGLAIPSLLNASHIIPWAKSEGRRADPRNGICLNALHDRAFDRGFISFDEDCRVLVTRDLSEVENLGSLVEQLKGVQGKSLSMPERLGPLPEAMAYHREYIFQSG